MKDNKKRQRSVNWIVEALFQLMETTAYKDITITQIANKAGVSRLTYYRNFNTKDDIILLYYELTFEEFLLKFDVFEDNALSIYDVVKLTFDFFSEKRSRTELLVKNNLTYISLKEFSRYITTVLTKVDLNNNLTFLQLKFIEGGLYYTLFDLTFDLQNYSSEKIAKELLEIILH